MRGQGNYLVVSMVLLMVGTLLAACGSASPAGAPGPEGTPPPPASPTAAGGVSIVTAAEGAMSARPDPQQAPGSLQISGRLLRPAADSGAVLQTFYLGNPLERPAEGWVTLRDPGGLLPSSPAGVPGPLLSLAGVFTATHLAGIALGTLEVTQATLLTLDEATLTQAADRAMRTQADRLAALAYTPLALPAFGTPTAAWHPQAAIFQAGGSRFYGLAADGTPIAYWTGPPLPGLPERPQVTRWPAIYALFENTTVDTLIVTIEGQADE